jgi:CheY-like chemotaxis protein
MSTAEVFLHHLHDALVSLYDPLQLRKNLLVKALQIEQQPDPAAALRQRLIAAIDALKPSATVPTHTTLYGLHHLLTQRFVEQFTQKEVAADFGLSVRQLRRREQKAIALLADQLAALYGLTMHRVSEAPAGDSASTLSAPSRQAELAWSQKTFVGTRVACEPWLTAVVEAAEPLLRVRQMQVQLHLPPALPHLTVDAVIARQALLSLLTMLAHQLPRQRLVIRASATAQAVDLQIAPAPEQPTDSRRTLRLTDRDVVDSLQAAHDLLALCGGTLSLAAQPAPQPTWLTITLPAEQPISVLVVDDNPDTLQLFSRYTASSRYTVIGVRNPAHVLELACTVRPALIVLDVMLPEIDGWQLLGQLSTHPLLEEARILICTILPQEQLALALGADAFLRKPVSRDDFLAALTAQLPITINP